MTNQHDTERRQHSREEASHLRDEEISTLELREAIAKKKGAFRYSQQTLDTCDAYKPAELGEGDLYCTVELKDGTAHRGKHSWER